MQHGKSRNSPVWVDHSHGTWHLTWHGSRNQELCGPFKEHSGLEEGAKEGAKEGEGTKTAFQNVRVREVYRHSLVQDGKPQAPKLEAVSLSHASWYALSPAGFRALHNF